MEEKILQVTSIETLREASNGSLVELPPFTSDSEFIVRLRRPSMLGLARKGKIPNSLLKAANSLFADGLRSGFDSLDDNMLSDMFGILDVICEEAFVEPTLEQLKDADIKLTDEQYIAVFDYVQNGLKQLESFR